MFGAFYWKQVQSHPGEYLLTFPQFDEFIWFAGVVLA